MWNDDDETLRLPWAGEFSPGQLGEGALSRTLQIVNNNSGHRAAIVEAIRIGWFSNDAESRADPQERLKQQSTRASNTLKGMQWYGLVDDDVHLSELGISLLNNADREAQSAQFATHLLKYRRGLELLDLATDLKTRQERVNATDIRRELRRRGYQLTTNSGDPGKLRQWLSLAGLVNDQWTVNQERVAELAGTGLRTVAEWQALTRVQRIFLTTIRRLAETRGGQAIPSPELLDAVRHEHGPIFDEGQVRKIYERLSNDGWITHTASSRGRGGKGGDIAASTKLIEVDFELLTGFHPGDLPADLRAVMTTPLTEIYTDLESTDTYTKGLTLELLAVNLASDLGLQPFRLRVRGTKTGGAEVDLVAEGTHLQFSRWLFQCKNTRSIDVGVLAKEIGMATLLSAHVVVIVATGSVSSTVRIYAERVSQTTSLQVVLIDQVTLEIYRSGGALALRAFFVDQARTTMRLKRAQVTESLEDLADDAGTS